MRRRQRRVTVLWSAAARECWQTPRFPPLPSGAALSGRPHCSALRRKPRGFGGGDGICCRDRPLPMRDVEYDPACSAISM